MSKVYVIVGCPGAGKSTWAANNKDKYDVLVSSDEYRDKLLGSRKIQANGDLVFNVMKHDIISYLSINKSICFDATNVDIRSRKYILDICSKFKNVNIIAVVFDYPIEILYNQNRNRRYAVPDEVVDKFFNRFKAPTIEEGFSEVIYYEKDCDKKEA